MRPSHSSTEHGANVARYRSHSKICHQIYLTSQMVLSLMVEENGVYSITVCENGFDIIVYIT